MKLEARSWKQEGGAGINGFLGYNPEGVALVYGARVIRRMVLEMKR